MLIRAHGAIAALALAFASVPTVPSVLAQTPSPAQSDQDHKAHHPDGKVPGTEAAPPRPPGTPPQMGTQPGMKVEGGMMGGMMCSDMKQMTSMMQDMHAMMRAHSGMMASRVEADITRLKADLKIADAQAVHWDRFADTLRRLAKSMDETHQGMMTAEATLPSRLARMEKAMLANLNSVRALEESLQPLYAALSDEQRKIIDKMRLGPMGMM
jgi:hypothetical protein